MEKLRVGYEMANSWFDPPLVRAARQRRERLRRSARSRHPL